MEGIIKSGVGGLYEVFLQDGTILLCRAAGKIRLTGEKPLPGDRVDIQENGDEGYLTEILPRKNMLIRPACANIDNLVIAFSPRSPKPDTFFIDTLTVQCEAAGITPILCITKSDLDKNGQLDYLKCIYEKTGYTMIVTSAKTQDGYEQLKPYLKGKITAFSGCSGVGKSTLLSLIAGISLQTGDISKKTARGKHTTRHTELYSMDGGYVLDTPGFSAIAEPDMEPEAITKLFPEFSECTCRFPDCMHIAEPECGVLEACRNGKISQSRYDSYAMMVQKRKTMLKLHPELNSKKQ